MPELSRLQKLEILADIWIKVYVFHPAIVMDAPRLDGHSLLLENIAAVEQAETLEALVQILNQDLLRHLSDPLTFVYALDNPPSFEHPCRSGFKRLHAGWNEDGHPYVYQQRWIESTAAPDQSHYFNTLGLSLNTLTTQAPPPAMRFPVCESGSATRLRRAQRLLGLFKVYGVLRYFSPFFMAERFDLAAWIPQIEAAQTLPEYCQCLTEFCAPLNDGHVQVVYPDNDAVEEATSPPKPYGFNLPEVMKHTRQLADGIGYMTPFTMPNEKTLDAAFELLKHTKALIIDLRGYPKTHFKQAFIQHLCDYPVKSPHYYMPIVSSPDLRARRWQHIQYTIEPKTQGLCYPNPVIALIDETVQSAAEDFVMYLRSAKRAVLVGTTTAGCQGNAAFIELPGGGWLSFTGMRVTYPGGAAVQGIGIVPDVEVTITAEDKDDILEKSIAVVDRV